MCEIAVSAVQFDDIVTNAIDARGGLGEFPDDALDVVLCHCVRHGPASVVGNCRGRFRGPAAFFLGQDRLAAGRRRCGRPLTSRMSKLNAELGDTVLTAEIMDALKRLLVVVRPHARASW